MSPMVATPYFARVRWVVGPTSSMSPAGSCQITLSILSRPKTVTASGFL